jgi:hypothetical protein
MSMKSWAKELVIDILEDERTQAVGMKFVATTVLPIIPVAIGAAVEKAMDRLTDLDQDGKPDIGELTDAAKQSIDKLLPPGINLPVIGDLGKFIDGFFPNLS